MVGPAKTDFVVAADGSVQRVDLHPTRQCHLNCHHVPCLCTLASADGLAKVAKVNDLHDESAKNLNKVFFWDMTLLLFTFWLLLLFFLCANNQQLVQ